MWKTAGCAVAGVSHQKRSLPCQDRIASLHDGHVDAIALADGAGSASLSHEGAEIVCREILADLSEHFDHYFNSEENIRNQMLENLRLKLYTYAQTRKCRTSDLYSTLLAAAVQDGRAIILHLGDGVIGQISGNEIRVLSEPTNGEFLNETVFVSLPGSEDQLQIIRVDTDDIAGFVLMSDGSAESLYNRREKQLAPVLARLGQKLIQEDPDHFSGDLAYTFSQILCSKTSDDCSINFLISTGMCTVEEIHKLHTIAHDQDLPCPMLSSGNLPTFRIRSLSGGCLQQINYLSISNN